MSKTPHIFHTHFRVTREMQEEKKGEGIQKAPDVPSLRSKND